MSPANGLDETCVMDRQIFGIGVGEVGSPERELAETKLVLRGGLLVGSDFVHSHDLLTEYLHTLLLPLNLLQVLFILFLLLFQLPLSTLQILLKSTVLLVYCLQLLLNLILLHSIQLILLLQQLF